MAGSRALALGLLSAPLPAVAIGVVVMRGAGLPADIWLLNVAAALMGVLMAGVAWARAGGTTPTRGSLMWVIPIGLALLGTTLLAPGTEGVHRWLPVGPLQIHAGALLLPAVLVALSGAPWGVSVWSALTILLALALQPDAAQAISFCAGWIVLAAARRGREALGVMLASVAVGAVSLFRVDPLSPVPHVEGILGMAAAEGLVFAGGGLLSLSVLPLSFFLCAGRPLGAALAVYMTGTLAAAWLGDCPVPVLGHGVSPILGYYWAAAACGSLTPSRARDWI